MALEERTYAKMAAKELNNLVDQLDELDPDIVEGFLSMGVLKVTFYESEVCVINSHQAAREIWMAWDAHAWHFGWDAESNTWRCTRTGIELYENVTKVVNDRTGLGVSITPAS